MMPAREKEEQKEGRKDPCFNLKHRRYLDWGFYNVSQFSRVFGRSVKKCQILT